MQPPAGAAKDFWSVHGQPPSQGKTVEFSTVKKQNHAISLHTKAFLTATFSFVSPQIVARKEQLSLAKTELKQAKKEVKEKGSADTKLQTYVLQ